MKAIAQRRVANVQKRYGLKLKAKLTASKANPPFKLKPMVHQGYGETERVGDLGQGYGRYHVIADSPSQTGRDLIH